MKDFFGLMTIDLFFQDEELDLLDRDYMSLNFTFDVIEYFSKSRGNSFDLRAVNLKEIKN